MADPENSLSSLLDSSVSSLSSSMDVSRSSRSSTRGVSFGTLEIREHPVVLGLNPSTTHGPALEIDWEPQNIEQLDVNEYEALRPPRREKQNLAMPGIVRESL